MEILSPLAPFISHSEEDFLFMPSFFPFAAPRDDRQQRNLPPAPEWSEDISLSDRSRQKHQQQQASNQAAGKPSKSKRRVRFSNRAEELLDFSVPLTDVEKSQCYVTARDMERYEEDCIRCLRMYELRNNRAGSWAMDNTADDANVRGLEDSLDHALTKRRTLHRRAVLVKQEQLREKKFLEAAVPTSPRGVMMDADAEGRDDTDWGSSRRCATDMIDAEATALAMVSKRRSRRCRMTAQARGKADAAAAASCLRFSFRNNRRKPAPTFHATTALLSIWKC